MMNHIDSIVVNAMLAEMTAGRWSPPEGSVGAAVVGPHPGPSDRRLFSRFVNCALRFEGLWWMVLAEPLDRVSHSDLIGVTATWDAWVAGERVFRSCA